MKWELSKLINNWRKAVTVFLLPAILMMLALNLFPALINYMSTGSFGRKPVLVINAPHSFIDYVNGEGRSASFSYEYMAGEDVVRDELYEEVSHGRLIVSFCEGFDQMVSEFYNLVGKGYYSTESSAKVTIYYDGANMSMGSRALQFNQDVMDPYRDSLATTLGGEYADYWEDLFLINDFNPVTDIVRNRGVANEVAARVIPGVVVLLLYYCVYSLSCDMFAAERDRGFLNKLILTPVPLRSILMGKTLAIVLISFISGLVTFAVLFFASWLNRSNDAMALIPFGMLLTPKEFLAFLLVLPPAAFVMTAVCIKIVFSLDKMQDILVNLQFPLILLLMEFFIQMIRPVAPFYIEFAIPFHSAVCALMDVFSANIRPGAMIVAATVDIITGILLMISVYNKLEGKGKYARSTKRL